ncbi:MAG: hypothetical protein ABFR19_05085 [Pseudomonadota bacterium]
MLTARYAKRKVCFFHLTPLYTEEGWYFKTQSQRHSRGPYQMLQDAESAAKELIGQQKTFKKL